MMTTGSNQPLQATPGLYWLQTKQWIGLLSALLLLVLLFGRGKLESSLKAQPLHRMAALERAQAMWNPLKGRHR